MVYGAILGAFGATAVALSLAEMASMCVPCIWLPWLSVLTSQSDPIVGAQYRWSANFAPLPLDSGDFFKVPWKEMPRKTVQVILLCPQVG